MTGWDPGLVADLRVREAFRDAYFERRDPVGSDRMLWRAQTARHLVHLLPTDRVLEIGCGAGHFTRRISSVGRGENDIVALRFADETLRSDMPANVRTVQVTDANRELEIGAFDVVVGMDMLDARTCVRLLALVHRYLAPGGRLVFFESNPWNPMLRLNRWIGSLVGHRDPRLLIDRPRLYELLSEIGFIRLFAVYGDFVYAPLTQRLVWALRNLSIILENTPAVRTLAGTITLHAQKMPTGERRPVRFKPPPGLERGVSVVIPCRNEEMNIGPLIAGLIAYYGDHIHEIIPVDDGSSDATRSVLASIAAEEPRVRPIHRDPPNGVGRALADGYRSAGGRWILSMDCDFQHLLPELRDLFDAAGSGYDVVVGSRFSRHSVLLNYPLGKIVANRLFHLFARIILRAAFRDLTNNLKLIRREVAEQLMLEEPHFAANAETGLQPLLLGCAVREVPISWVDRSFDMGASSFRLMQVGGGYWRVLHQLWLSRFFGAGRYGDRFRRPGKGPRDRAGGKRRPRTDRSADA